LKKAGVELSNEAENKVEVSFLVSYEGEGLEFLKDGEITEAGFINEIGLFVSSK